MKPLASNLLGALIIIASLLVASAVVAYGIAKVVIWMITSIVGTR